MAPAAAPPASPSRLDREAEELQEGIARLEVERLEELGEPIAVLYDAGIAEGEERQDEATPATSISPINSIAT